MSFNFRQQSVGETTYLTYEIEDDLEVDSFAMQMMANNRFTHIVPTQIVRINEKRQIQFNITGLVKLNSRISLPRPKREVLRIFSSILNAFEEVDAYMLDMERLFLEWEYIYLDGQGNCMLVYLPFAHTFSKDKIAFLQELVSKVPPDYQQKDTYLYDILNAFSRGAIQKLSDFREIIKKSASVSNDVSSEKKESKVIMQKQEMAVKHQEKEEKPIPKPVVKRSEKKPAHNPKIPVVNIPGREPGAKEIPPIPENKSEKKDNGKKKGEKKEKRGIFSIHKKPKPDNGGAEVSDTGKIQNDTELTADREKDRGNGMYESYVPTFVIHDPKIIQRKDEETVMLEQQDFVTRPSARLVRNRDRTEYRINRDKMIVGSGAAADIRIDNNAVSRSHAVIIYTGNDYYFEDNQSKNGSFVNGKRLQSGIRENLYDGMLLRLANEEFTFYKD